MVPECRACSRSTQATGIPSTAIASSADYQMGAMDMTNAQDADIKFFDKLGVAVIKGGVEHLAKLASLASDESEVMAVVPERFVFPSDGFSAPIPGQPIDGGGGGGPGAATRPPCAGLYPGKGQRAPGAVKESVEIDGEGEGRWCAGASPRPCLFGRCTEHVGAEGYRACRWAGGNTGQGIKVAILDTGIDLNHPDFAGRLNPGELFGVR